MKKTRRRTQQVRYSVMVSHADLAAANTALAAISGDFDGLLATSLILDADEDDATPRYHGCTVLVQQDPRLASDHYRLIRGAISGLDSFREDVVNGRKTREDEDAFRAWAATYGLRCPGQFLEAFGTARADGSADAQAVTTEAIRCNQWTAFNRLIVTTRQGQTLKTGVDGAYRYRVKLRFVPVEGVTFSVRMTIGPNQVGQTHSSAVGGATINGITNRENIATERRIGMHVSASEPAAFQLLGGSIMRLKRTG